MSKVRESYRWLASGAFGRVCVLALASLIIGLIFERVWWVADAFAQLRFHNTMVLLILGIGFAVAKRKKWLVSAAAGVAVGLAFTIPPLLWVAPRTSGWPSEYETIKVLSHNLEYTNDNYEAELREIEAANADVVILLEVTYEWKKHLEQLEDVYDQHLIEAEGGQFGIAMFSNLPDTEMQLEDFGGYDMQSIVARMKLGDQKITVVGTHPPPAVGGGLFEMRKWYLESMARNLAVETDPLIVTGDLNITPAGADYRKLLGALQLRSTAVPFRSTWSPFGIPGISARLDHMLVSEDWLVVSSKIGPSVGSDHRMLITELSLD